MSGARISLDRTRLHRMLNTVGGVGDRLLRRKAERVAELARVYAASHGSIPEGIIVGPFRDGKIDVISTNPHTLLVHNGSPKHILTPRRANYLRFTVNGRVVFARIVHHPGYKGDPFLTNALRDAT
jgi:hypothetical protein